MLAQRSMASEIFMRHPAINAAYGGRQKSYGLKTVAPHFVIAIIRYSGARWTDCMRSIPRHRSLARSPIRRLRCGNSSSTSSIATASPPKKNYGACPQATPSLRSGGLSTPAIDRCGELVPQYGRRTAGDLQTRSGTGDQCVPRTFAEGRCDAELGTPTRPRRWQPLSRPLRLPTKIHPGLGMGALS